MPPRPVWPGAPLWPPECMQGHFLPFLCAKLGEGGGGGGLGCFPAGWRPRVPGTVPVGRAGSTQPSMHCSQGHQEGTLGPPFGSPTDHNPWVVSDHEYLHSSACLQPGELSNTPGCPENRLKSSLLLSFPGETSKAPTSPGQRRPRQGTIPGSPALGAGRTAAAPFTEGSAWHLSGSSGVLRRSEGETENLPGAIFLSDLLSHVFPLGMDKKYFSE